MNPTEITKLCNRLDFTFIDLPDLISDDDDIDGHTCHTPPAFLTAPHQAPPAAPLHIPNYVTCQLPPQQPGPLGVLAGYGPQAQASQLQHAQPPPVWQPPPQGQQQSAGAASAGQPWWAAAAPAAPVLQQHDPMGMTWTAEHQRLAVEQQTRPAAWAKPS
ncbi:hypothetical protein PLESTB_000697000 [Pleodorina starrii]|uniref:Uncharacterized protein n=1 Tax=Pleodorina starrii TaxID=330485 RepID=A0A9W6BIV7_9CHLO|nr:hypothetical protein PLESTM_001219900 [Pleodorina starrii]GLC52997.1 hypothetical protein PLESTB_000697000 [Pleodorina starrii]GLC65293.1 hypothetical protein PLESTF_000273300 [Pleodorina starrii]